MNVQEKNVGLQHFNNKYPVTLMQWNLSVMSFCRVSNYISYCEILCDEG